ncbi:hypothetical protein QYM36_019008 [Artemia franciscana]|uniref:Uncharacterized protein n=1 Tax=Artemia franciscana TaxID=6661 RepID=A0AA88H7Y8_ARTSF|nr:hypothetical protein QYM36_019008 [Artemia franciscana]
MLHHRDVVCNPTTASIPGYVLYTRNRTDKDGNITTHGGGVGVYIKEDVEHNILKLNEHMHIHELLWVKILVLNPNKVCSESAVLAAALKWRLFENGVISDLEVVEETSFEVFSLFIDVLQSECVFSRALSLNAESSLGLFALADKYICPNLETGVLALFYSHTSPENAALMCELASDLLCKPYLAKYATRVFLNGSSEALSEKALQCSVETLTMLISDTNFSLDKESQLFDFIERYKTQHGYDVSASVILSPSLSLFF